MRHVTNEKRPLLLWEMDMTASVRTHQILYKQQHPLREHLLEHPLSTAEQQQCTLGKLQWEDGNRNFNFF